MKLRYKDQKHEAAFSLFLQQADLEIKDMAGLTMLERRQLAFLYLTAMYQEDYERYEGECFYIENLGELSLGGPTYLLDDQMGEMKRPHEEILLCGKAILKGEKIVPQAYKDEEWIKEAIEKMGLEGI